MSYEIYYRILREFERDPALSQRRHNQNKLAYAYKLRLPDSGCLMRL